LKVKGTLQLDVSTTSGKVLHQQKWTVGVEVPRTEMGVSSKLTVPVNWTTVPTNLDGEVLLFSLVLFEPAARFDSALGAGADAPIASTGAHVISKQLYTFGVLPVGSNVNDKMDKHLPMRALLTAPPASCPVLVAPPPPTTY
jgi:hypothetical protein